MHAQRFDHLAKACGAASSRRRMIRGLLGGVLGLSRVAAAGASHKMGHHCTPSDEHACAEGQTCREVSGAWICTQDTCLAGGAVCAMSSDCCSLCCEILPGATSGVCDNDCGFD